MAGPLLGAFLVNGAKSLFTVVAPDLDDQLVILADSGLTADLVPALLQVLRSTLED
mgnify:CR=1 FL=1